MEKNISKVRDNDAVVGVLYLVCVLLNSYTIYLDFLWIAAA